jgi:predicted DCC family thiol-disulfide oxidoreductase YuxK
MSPEWVFYDGTCGFCHRWIRLVMSADKTGIAFRFSPRTGETFAELVPAGIRVSLPPSILVLTRDGRVLTRSTAVLYILNRLGGMWRALSFLGGLVPKALRDPVYAVIARVRHRLYPKPEGVCPVVAPELRSRFAP